MKTITALTTLLTLTGCLTSPDYRSTRDYIPYVGRDVHLLARNVKSVEIEVIHDHIKTTESADPYTYTHGDTITVLAERLDFYENEYGLKVVAVVVTNNKGSNK